MLRGIAGFALILVVAGQGLAAPIAKGQVSASDACGGCHKDIYRMWRTSAHAGSLEDPIFLDAYRETQAREGEEVSRICLRCHAPVAELNKDMALKQKITWEGVNCDVCHSLASVDLTATGARQVLDVGPVKRGPIRDASSSAHEVLFSELHTKPLACAGCHEYTNPQGVPILSTYSEWMESSAAREGKGCQSCHMDRTQAHVVDPRVARVALAEVNLHEMPGGHSLEQLHKALRIAIDATREGDTLAVAVRVINKGAGHAVPTGMPGRRVVMDVQVRTSENKSFEESRVYSRTFSDAQGAVITRDAGFFAKGVQPAADTRIRPDEKRIEMFRWPVPAGSTAYLSLKLHYEHAPTGGAEGRTYLTFLSEDRVFLPGTSTGPPGR